MFFFVRKRKQVEGKFDKKKPRNANIFSKGLNIRKCTKIVHYICMRLFACLALEIDFVRKDA